MHHVAGVLQLDLAPVAERAPALGKLLRRVLHTPGNIGQLARHQQHRRGDPPPAGDRLVDAEQVRIDVLVPGIAQQDDFARRERLCPVPGEERRFFRGQARVGFLQAGSDFIEGAVRPECRRVLEFDTRRATRSGRMPA
jgi:hypothetical protein